MISDDNVGVYVKIVVEILNFRPKLFHRPNMWLIVKRNFTFHVGCYHVFITWCYQVMHKNYGQYDIQIKKVN